MEGENNVSVVPNTVRKEENVQVEVEGCFHSKRICILTTGKSNIFESFKIIHQGKGYWVRAKETTGWFPKFDEQNKDNSDSEDEQSVITKWNGEVIVMGNFNEVRYKNKRYGSVFHAHGADAFNSFISNANLQEIPLGGCAFTWCHRSASKMTIQEVDKVDNMEVVQKAKIKWAIEGDKNIKYYHGILNKKRNQLAIRGVLKDGIWIENPNLVKSEFLLHFKNRFQKPCSVRPVLDMTFPRQLSAMQHIDMESDVSYQEIKRAVWDCGVDKSPRSDSFTFGFIRRFWSLLEKDVVAAVKYFLLPVPFLKDVTLRLLH
nr:RNA-directed DNA polymerase, eukaryota [Tanacetum cinerariifolium]